MFWFGWKKIAHRGSVDILLLSCRFLKSYQIFYCNLTHCAKTFQAALKLIKALPHTFFNICQNGSSLFLSYTPRNQRQEKIPSTKDRGCKVMML